MRKKNPKYKEWLKRRLRHIEKKRRKKNRPKNSIKNNYQPKSVETKTDNKIFVVNAPENFSIINNPKETINFFTDVLNFTNSNTGKLKLFFDLSRIRLVTADAIIYLLAVIKDLQRGKFIRREFSGNLPVNPNANKFFKQSGFFNHVNSASKGNDTLSNYIQIVSNKQYNQAITKTICDFVLNNSKYTRTDTKFLYVLINEMMLNTYQHAYDSLQSNKTNSWYLFAQKDTNVLKFTFVDTGLGIPATVTKKWHDKIKSQSKLITSALNGDFRTQTLNEFRGKGLPKIKECVAKHNIEKLYIISNKAYCVLNNRDVNEVSISEQEMTRSITGTIYYWEIKIGGNND